MAVICACVVCWGSIGGVIAIAGSALVLRHGRLKSRPYGTYTSRFA